MNDDWVHTHRSKRYVLPGGTQQPIHEVDIEEPGSLSNAVKLLVELNQTLKGFHSGGGVADGALTVDFSAEVPAGRMLFVPFFLGKNHGKKPVSVPKVVKKLSKYGLRLATPYETLCWYRTKLSASIGYGRPEGLESDGVFAFGGCRAKSHALLITQMSCRIMYILGRRRPDQYPMMGVCDIPYYFSIATVVNVPTTVRADQHGHLYKPKLPKAA